MIVEMIERPRASIVITALVGLTLTVWAQAPSDGPQLTIISPGDDAYLVGPTLLRAGVDPPEAVVALTFFVDGRQACALTRLPFECDLVTRPVNAGRQVRALDTLRGNASVVKTVRI